MSQDVLSGVQEVLVARYKQPYLAPVRVPLMSCLPYEPSLLIVEVTEDNSSKGRRLKCPHCTSSMLLAELRRHVAKHILQGQADGKAWAASCCGWCAGPMGDEEGCCSVGLKQGSTKAILVPVGRCTFMYQFRMGAAVKEAKGAAAFTTNVPIKCTACPVDTAVWKYAMATHFRGACGPWCSGDGKYQHF